MTCLWKNYRKIIVVKMWATGCIDHNLSMLWHDIAILTQLL